MNEDYKINGDNIDRNMKYKGLCIPPNQPDSVNVQIILPNNTYTRNFALWDTILDIKHYILRALQPKIDNIQQIECVIQYSHKQKEVNDHTELKNIWNNCPIQILVNIKHCEDIKKIYHSSNNTEQHNAIHPEHGNVLDTNAIIPWPASGYKNKKTGKIYKNVTVQTVLETLNSNNQYNENKKSLSIQTYQIHDATTEVFVEIGTQSEPINILQTLNIISEKSNYNICKI